MIIAKSAAPFRRPLLSGVSTAIASQEGANLVETALSIGLLLTFMFGVIEISLAGYTYHFISEAAREGTRYAIVRGSQCTSWGSACPASGADIKTYVEGLGYPGIDPSKMGVYVTFASYAGTGCPAAPALCDNPGDTVKVQVTYAFPFSVPFVPANTFNMSSTSQMVIAN
jgi:Flp pilus assembly protein TadG